MGVIAYTIARPRAGMRQILETRARTLAGIYARHGASVKPASIVSGPNAGCMALLREYPSFRAAAKAFTAIQNDPANTDFWREREANPAGDIVVLRDLIRTVHGENQWETHPVSLVRRYELARDKIDDALKLIARVEKLVAKAGVNTVVFLPITGEDLSTLGISYQFHSMEHWGEALDEIGTSEAFQSLVAKAAAIGTLRSAFAMVPL